MIFHLDEPSDPIATCMYHAASLASRSVKVVLTGDGGDEVFAGFDRYFGLGRVRWYAMLPEWARRLLLGPAMRSLPDSAGYKTLVQKARWLHDLSFHTAGRRYAEATVFFRFGEGTKKGLYSDALKTRLAGRDATDCIVSAFEGAVADDDLDRMLFADCVTRLPEHSLMLTDRMTMAHGLEARSPFLDRPLAEFVAALPASLKLRGRRLKYLMRRVAEELLPRSILHRPKQGFMFPLGYWMKGPLVPVLRRLLDDSRLVDSGLFNREAIVRLFEEHLSSVADHHARLWMVLNLEIWYRMYLLGEATSEVTEFMRTEQVGAHG
jgi:asparagine synthase (glutamine-hydrolysing)